MLTISGKLYPVLTLLMGLGHDFQIFQKVSNQGFLQKRMLRQKEVFQWMPVL